ncbi:MAG: type II toxin-antitoxin system HicA family toxin [Ktedonobacterales bacterium]
MKVREAIRELEADGWYLVTTKGDHRQFKHPNKPGRVTVPGHPNDDLAPKHATASFDRRDCPNRGKDMRYLIIIEQADHNLSAYVPDLPGCVTTGATREEVIANMRKAIAFHLEGMRADGDPVPQPNSDPAWVDISQPAANVGIN